MNVSELTEILNLALNGGMFIIFLVLYTNEKKSHQVTREQYRADLREIAGLRQNIGRVQTYVSDAKQFPVQPEMKQAPSSKQ